MWGVERERTAGISTLDRSMWNCVTCARKVREQCAPTRKRTFQVFILKTRIVCREAQSVSRGGGGIAHGARPRNNVLAVDRSECQMPVFCCPKIRAIAVISNRRSPTSARRGRTNTERFHDARNEPFIDQLTLFSEETFAPPVVGNEMHVDSSSSVPPTRRAKSTKVENANINIMTPLFT